MEPEYHTIYLSPHPDDVVFSCAGSIAGQVARGERVLVVTACTAMAPATAPSEFAARMHRRWQLCDSEVVSVRLMEDVRALELLGVDSARLGLLDAIYRRPEVYDRHDRLFATLADDDSFPGALTERMTELCARFRGARVCVPLGVGEHVDHQAAHLAGRSLAGRGVEVSYYEDLPYALQPGSVEQRLARLGAGERARARVTDVAPALHLKLAAIR
ncbi:MAG: PIG-L family deacetylase, partial [Chloroflexota bacterium]|nr:PIG-L family deacetylase [Chloroflexota bacterium]